MWPELMLHNKLKATRYWGVAPTHLTVKRVIILYSQKQQEKTIPVRCRITLYRTLFPTTPFSF